MDLAVAGMTCASCVRRVEKAVRAVPGVSDVAVNLATERVRVRGAPDPAAVMAAVERAGYQAAAGTVDLRIAGMTCASCVGRVERALARVPGVLGAEVNLATETARVQVAGVDADALVRAVERAGYKAEPVVEGAATAESGARARESRLFTVPGGTPSASAV